MRSLRLWQVVVVLAFVAVSCGETEQTQFTSLTRSNFMAACSDSTPAEPLANDASPADQDTWEQNERLRLMRNEACVCVYERNGLTYREFSRYDSQLRDNLELDLQAAIVNPLARCILEIGEL